MIPNRFQRITESTSSTFPSIVIVVWLGTQTIDRPGLDTQPVFQHMPLGQMWVGSGRIRIFPCPNSKVPVPFRRFTSFRSMCGPSILTRRTSFPSTRTMAVRASDLWGRNLNPAQMRIESPRATAIIAASPLVMSAPLSKAIIPIRLRQIPDLSVPKPLFSTVERHRE